MTRGQPKAPNNGITLVEVIVVAGIMVVLAGMFISFMMLHNRAVNEGVAESHMRMQADLVSSEIARRVRTASYVFASDEGWESSPSLGARNVGAVVLYNTTGTVQRAYGISNGRLYEGPHAANLSIFTVGGDAVTLDPTASFGLVQERNSLQLNLQYTIQYKGKAYNMAPKGDMYQCRN